MWCYDGDNDDKDDGDGDEDDDDDDDGDGDEDDGAYGNDANDNPQGEDHHPVRQGDLLTSSFQFLPQAGQAQVGGSDLNPSDHGMQQ